MSAAPPAGRQPRPVLLSRPDCQLCDELVEELRARGVAFDTVVVDYHPAWRERFGLVIPVLLDPATNTAVQETFFDAARLDAWLAGRG